MRLLRRANAICPTARGNDFPAEGVDTGGFDDDGLDRGNFEAAACFGFSDVLGGEKGEHIGAFGVPCPCVASVDLALVLLRLVGIGVGVYT